MGKKYLYMVHSLTDETYSLLCSYEPQEGMDTKKVMFLMSIFDHCYWLPQVLPWLPCRQPHLLDTTGIDFA